MNPMRRARPLLGTLVEIGVRQVRDGACAARAITAAFDVVGEVQARMSFHEEDSDVSRLNRARPGAIVAVSPMTVEVLRHARDVSRVSAGVFDVTVAPRIERLGFLPARGHWGVEPGASWRDIETLGDDRVRLRRSLRIDLGGIAKGYAVDAAIAALQARGVVAGHVNAGGDLRVVGDGPSPLHIRHPAVPTTLLPFTRGFGAVATSAGYYQSRRVDEARVCPLLDARSGRPVAVGRSITVFGTDCMTADALTKVVAADRRGSVTVLDHFGAEALVLESDGSGGACRLWASHPATLEGVA